MIRISLASLAMLFLTSSIALAEPPLTETYREPSARLIGEALTSSEAYDALGELCDDIGHRLSGSPQLDEAIAWSVDLMKAWGLENVHTEPVEVKRWVRGDEAAWMVEPRHEMFTILGLGNSLGTPEGGLTAETVVVGSFEELEALGESGVRGKIVAFDVPFVTYGETVRFRSRGPSAAAKLGAVAVLVRSVGPISYDTAHTGALSYSEDESIPKIPAAAITIENATLLRRIQERGDRITVHLEMDARFEDPVMSANVVGEIVGSERPEEVVIVGGHLDSWDVGQGAQDDGAGCLIALEAARIIRKLDLRPRRTVRVVFFTNEENGLAGGRTYAADHEAELGDIVAAIESDSGNGPADGFRVDVRPVPAPPRDADDATRAAADAAVAPDRERAVAAARAIGELLAPIGGETMNAAYSGADLTPMVTRGVTGLGLNHDSTKYFEIHHTKADTFEKIDLHDLRRNSAIMAVMTYVLADMPGRLLPDRTIPATPTEGD